MGTPWIYRLCSVGDDLVRRQATWQAAANGRSSQPGIERRCVTGERERDDVVAVGESGGEKDGKWRRRDGERRERGVCRGGVCVVLGLVVGAMRVVSE